MKTVLVASVALMCVFQLCTAQNTTYTCYVCTSCSTVSSSTSTVSGCSYCTTLKVDLGFFGTSYTRGCGTVSSSSYTIGTCSTILTSTYCACTGDLCTESPANKAHVSVFLSIVAFISAFLLQKFH